MSKGNAKTKVEASGAQEEAQDTSGVEEHVEYEVYEEDPLYQKVITQIQNGDWEASRESLNELIERYPLEQELRALRQEINLRSVVDEHEAEEQQSERRERRNAFFRTGVAVLIGVLLAVVVTGAYATWLRQQFAQTRQELANEVQEIELSVKFRNAQNLLQAGQPAEAVEILEEIQVFDPEYPQLDATLKEARRLAELESQYNLALDLVEEEDIAGALALLEEIYQEDPLYKDVDLKINELEKEYLLDGILADANSAQETGRWLEAVSSYESALEIDPSILEQIEEPLFLSYMNAAEAILVDEDLSIEELETAESYYRKSLSLRPQDKATLDRRAEIREGIVDLLVNKYIITAQAMLVDQEDSLGALQGAEFFLGKALLLRPESSAIRLQYNLARRFLAGVGNFDQGLWADVIEDMEFIYQEDQDYADGTALQLLYEAYVARGDNWLASGDFDKALSDFQRAAVIAQDSPDSVLRLYQAQLRVAFTLGRLRDYKEAVDLYGSAVDLAGIKLRALEEDTALANSITQAEFLADRGDYKTAYFTYAEALANSSQFYFQRTHIVGQGNYLAALARRYESTIQAILEANDITNPNNIYVGQELVIPSLP